MLRSGGLKGEYRVASSEDKRYQQSVKRHARNQSAKSRLKTLMKKVQAAVESGDAAAAEMQFRTAASALQKAGRKRVLHANTAARRVARLARTVHKSKTSSPSA
jgi:small subunit ribosomal protein S20